VALHLAASRAGCSTVTRVQRFITSFMLVSCLLAPRAHAAEGGAVEDPPPPPAREFFVGGGVTSMSTPPAGKVNYGPGINVVLYYGGRHFAGVAQFLVGGTYTDELNVVYGGYSAGARYRLFDAAVTPFAGAGLTAASAGFSSRGVDTGSNLGLAPYAELGAEFFRLSTIRGMLAVRVDQPLFDTVREENSRYDRAGQRIHDTVVTPFVPISVNLSVGWGFAERAAAR
jgi:hypothetical protein